MDIDFRRIFDTIPERFDAHRPRYCRKLFDDLISYACVDESKAVLELGPGTGQATEPILKTGCDYTAIELGENFTRLLHKKYDAYKGFKVINDDFITHDFGEKHFDLIYSAATIQWIPEKTAFEKTFSLLKPGGTLAMFFTYGDYKTPSPELFEKIQKVYREYFKPEIPYTHGGFRYQSAPLYGFTETEKREYYGIRELNADGYVALCGTHSDHLMIPEPYKSKFFAGLRKCVLDAGDRIRFNDTFTMYLTKKPL